jgi:hypothetical protein
MVNEGKSTLDLLDSITAFGRITRNLKRRRQIAGVHATLPYDGS